MTGETMYLTSRKTNKTFQTIFLPLLAGIGVALFTFAALSALRPMLVIFLFGGVAVFLPTLILKDPKLYWLFLFSLSLLFDISKRLTSWMAKPWVLFQEYGMPSSGNLSVHLYLSDIVLILLMIPWLCRLAFREEKIYFPKFAWIPVMYLAWATLGSLAHAISLQLSFFELTRQGIYFLSFLYLANNVNSKKYVRGIMAALVLGILIEAVAVIAAFQLQTTESAFGGIYQERSDQGLGESSDLYTSETDSSSRTKRSQGTFSHPAHAAYYFEYLLPLVLILIVVQKRAGPRLALMVLFLLGVTGLILTFSRSGFIGFTVGFFSVLLISRIRNIFSRSKFAVFLAGVIAVIIIASPFIYDFLTSRPKAFSYRFYLLEKGFEMYLENPVVGVGINNSSAANKIFQFKKGKGKKWEVIVIHNHYLIVAIETGIIGAILYFWFFVLIGIKAYRCSGSRDFDVSIFSVAILGAYFGLAVHNLAEPFGGHAVHSMLWLFAGLVAAFEKMGIEEENKAPVFKEPGGERVHSQSQGQAF